MDDLLKQILQKINEQQTLAEPSIMDEYIKQNDPEQYRKIEMAKQRQMAIEAGMQASPTVGALKNIPIIPPRSSDSPKVIGRYRGPEFSRYENELDTKFRNNTIEPDEKEFFNYNRQLMRNEYAPERREFKSIVEMLKNPKNLDKVYNKDAASSKRVKDEVLFQIKNALENEKNYNKNLLPENLRNLPKEQLLKKLDEVPLEDLSTAYYNATGKIIGGF